MVQPIKNKKSKPIPKTKKSVKKNKKEYGTSKLEERFAKEFLDKLKIKYVYQFKAESIGRFYDFYLPEDNLIIEVDGSYWHSYGLLYEEMTPTQKRNRRVDKQKDHWALINGIPILRIWEHDINNNPEKVISMLKEKVGYARKQKEINDNKRKRHNNAN